jgi:pyruvate/2-oxoglutarate/acetoin dehydrogenase E1 component
MAPGLTYLESLRRALHDILAQDPAAVVLGEDILDPYGGAFKVTQGLSTRFSDRVFTTPICEASIVGMSVGLALRGLHPIAEIMFGDFVALAADQLVNHAAKYPAMYNGQVTASLVVRTPMGGGRGYGPTHSQSLERLFFGIPHLKLIAAAHAHDAGALLRQAAADPEPVLFVEHKLLYPLPLLLPIGAVASSAAPAAGAFVPVASQLAARTTLDAFGYPVVTLANHSAGAMPDVTVVAYGGMSRLLAPVLARLADEEVWVQAVLPGCISPLDGAALADAAAASRRVLVVEESPAAFGWGAEVAAAVYERLGDRLLAPVRRLGAAPTVIPAAKPLEDQVLIGEAALEAAILELLRVRSP